MGTEPFVAALGAGAEVVLAGRAYDPAVFAAVPIRAGFDAGLALHLGKILECAAIAATPGSGADCMLGTVRSDHVEVEPLAPQRVCTVTSVAAHTLYEKSDPYLLPGPGGVLDLRSTTFTQVTPRAVRIAGTVLRRTPYAVKVEGAVPAGYRTIAIAGIRDPVLIGQIDAVVAAVRAEVAANLGLLLVLLPVPDSVKVAGGVLVGAAVLTFVPLMGAGIRAAVTAREDLLTEVAQRPADG